MIRFLPLLLMTWVVFAHAQSNDPIGTCKPFTDKMIPRSECNAMVAKDEVENPQDYAGMNLDGTTTSSAANTSAPVVRARAPVPFTVAFSDIMKRHTRIRKGPIYEACEQLMAAVRREYGRAPMCMVGQDARGNNFSNITHTIAVTDDGRAAWMFLNIQADSASRSFHYNRDELNRIEFMVQQGRGLTNEQKLQFLRNDTKSSVTETFNDARAVLRQGGTVLSENGKPMTEKQLDVEYMSWTKSLH